MVAFFSCTCLLLAGELPQGMQKNKPSSGRFVETDQGFMVPYKTVIPGTEIEFEMIPIPGGKFMLGSPTDEADRREDEGPQAEISVEPFWMAKCEVTWAEYKVFMKTYDIFKSFDAESIRVVDASNVADTITAPTPLYDSSFTYLLGEEDRQPAVTASHYAARQYTKWLSLMSGNIYRLPTEIEWEYACRAGTTTPYSFGDASEIDDYAWHYENSDEGYKEVGTKKPNPWGLHDMHGNVAEICLDQYEADAYGKIKSKKAADNIVWTTKMFPNVIRGGSWESDPPDLRSAARTKTEDWREEDPNLPRSPWWFTDEPALAVGFRLSRPLNPPAREIINKFWAEDSEMLKIAVENRLQEGRGARGLVDKDLPEAIKKIE